MAVDITANISDGAVISSDVVANQPITANISTGATIIADIATGGIGPAGAPGAAGVGVPTGGTTGQVLAKIDATDYNTQWVTGGGGGGGSGDVVGPASSTDNAVARFDATTGKLIQNSTVTVSDTGNIATTGTVDGRDLSTDGTKLDGIEAGADVTDATNVAAAGAFMKSVDDTDDITVGTINKFATAAEKTKLGFISVTQSVDLDTIESDTATNNAKVTNATHTGDATGATALTLATVNSNVGSFGSATQVPTFTVNGKGLTTAASNTTIQIAESQVTNLVTDLSNKQPLDADLTTIAGLTATTDNFIQSKAGAWASRTVAQVKTDLSLTGVNSGDQTSIVGITGTTAEFNTALTDGDFATGGGTATGTNTGDNAVNSLYSGLVSNATHTGEVTGATALTVDKTAITNKTLVTAASADKVLIADASDTDNLKYVTAQSIADLGGGGGSADYKYYVAIGGYI